MADDRDGNRWATKWLLGAGLLLALLAVTTAFAPIAYSTESDSCGSAWNPDYPDRALSNGGGCGYWLTFMTRMSLGLLAAALVLVAIATWQLLRTSRRSLADAVPVS